GADAAGTAAFLVGAEQSARQNADSALGDVLSTTHAGSAEAAFSTLRGKLLATQGATWLNLGDSISTGTTDEDWFWVIANELAVEFPDVGVTHRRSTDTPTVISSGSVTLN